MSSRILSWKYLKHSSELTLKQYPEMYLALSYFTVGFGLCMWKVYSHLYIEDTTINRYKRHYTVFRPDDLRLKFYPKHYVTDAELLAADHPATTHEAAANIHKVLFSDDYNNRY